MATLASAPDIVSAQPITEPKSRSSPPPSETGHKVRPSEFHPNAPEPIAHQERQLEVLSQRRIFSLPQLGERIYIAQQRITNQEGVTITDIQLDKLSKKNKKLQEAYEAYVQKMKSPFPVKEGEKAENFEFQPGTEAFTVEEICQLDMALRVVAAEYMAAGGYVLDRSRDTPREIEVSGTKTKQRITQKGKLVKVGVSITPFSETELGEIDRNFLSKDQDFQEKRILDLLYEEQQLRVELIGYDTSHLEFENDFVSKAYREEVNKLLKDPQYQGKTFDQLFSQDAAAIIGIQSSATKRATIRWGATEAKTILTSSSEKYLTSGPIAQATKQEAKLRANVTTYEAYPDKTTQAAVDHNEAEIKAGRAPTLALAAVTKEEAEEIKRKATEDGLDGKVRQRNELTARIEKIGDTTNPAEGTLLYPIVEELITLQDTDPDKGTLKKLEIRMNNAAGKVVAAVDARAYREFSATLSELKHEYDTAKQRERELLGQKAELVNDKAGKESELVLLKPQIDPLDSRGLIEKTAPPPATSIEKADQIKRIYEAATSEKLSAVQSQLMIEAERKEAFKSMESLRALLGLDYDILTDRRARNLLVQLLRLDTAEFPDLDDVVDRKTVIEARRTEPTKPLDTIITDVGLRANIENADTLNEKILKQLRLKSPQEASMIILAIMHERLGAGAAGEPTKDFGIAKLEEILPKEIVERNGALRSAKLLEGINSARFGTGVDVKNKQEGITHYEIISQGGNPPHIFEQTRDAEGNVILKDLEEIGLKWNPTAVKVEKDDGIPEAAKTARKAILVELVSSRDYLDKKARKVSRALGLGYRYSQITIGGETIHFRFNPDNPQEAQVIDNQGKVSETLKNYLANNSNEEAMLEAARGLVEPVNGLVDAGRRIENIETTLASNKITRKDLTATRDKLTIESSHTGGDGTIIINKNGVLELDEIPGSALKLSFNAPEAVLNYLAAADITGRGNTADPDELAAKAFRTDFSIALFKDYYLNTTPQERRALPFPSRIIRVNRDYITPAGTRVVRAMPMELFKSADGEIMIRNLQSGTEESLVGYSNRLNAENAAYRGNPWVNTHLPFLQEQAGNQILIGLSKQIMTP